MMLNDMIKFRDNRKGIAPVLEYIFSITIFILILSIYFSSIDTLLMPINTDTTELEEKGIIIAENLMGNRGEIRYSDNPELTVENWGGNPGRELNDPDYFEIRTLGLRSNRGNYGVLDYNKIVMMMLELDENNIRDALGMKENVAFNISVRSLDSDIIELSVGKTTTLTTKNLISIERFCVIENIDAKIMGKLTIKLFYGGKSI